MKRAFAIVVIGAFLLMVATALVWSTASLWLSEYHRGGFWFATLPPLIILAGAALILWSAWVILEGKP